jgi:hypothetical protein
MPDIDAYLDGLDPAQREIADALVPVLEESATDAVGQVWHGHPVWLIDGTPVAGFKAYPRYVTFMIWGGHLIADESGRLERGARMGTVKLSSVDEVDAELFSQWLQQADPVGHS